MLFSFVNHFKRNTFGQYLKGIVIFKYEKIHFLVKVLSSFFTVNNLNYSYFIYELCSKFQKNNFCGYSNGISVFKFQKFHLLVILF